MSVLGGAVALQLTGVTRTYDDGHPVHAVRPTTFTVAAGDHVAVTGPSGSGKSTLLNLLGLLDRPTAGSYRVFGTEVAGLAETARSGVRCHYFGFVFQAFHLLPGRSATENVELGMLYGRHGPRERRRRATAALERVGVGHRAAADPRRLSGGERQRVAIARAIAGRPEVLFCDEPTGNLDETNSAGVLALLQELNREGLTLVVVTHDAGIAAAAPRRLRVRNGVVTEGSP